MSDSAKVKQVGIQMVVVLVVVALLVGWAGSHLLGGGQGSDMVSTTDGGESAERLYTCGMHPNVIQKGPGICPICEMKLTPVRTESADGLDGGPTNERKILYWRAPMDPNYVSDVPGKSPMGMDLVPVYADAAESAGGHVIRIPRVTIQNMAIRTAVLGRGPLIKTIRTVGRVAYDEQQVTFINTKFEGWLEKLHVDQTGQLVSEGQPLFDVYSRELYSAQKEYLSAIEGLARMSKSTLTSARQEQQRLIEAAQIDLQGRRPDRW